MKRKRKDEQHRREWEKQGRQRAERMLGPARNLLAQEVDFAAAQLAGAGDAREGRGLALRILYHVHVEALDAIDILLSSGAGASALVQLRTSLEATAQLCFVAQDQTPWRGLAYLMSGMRGPLQDLSLFTDSDLALMMKGTADAETSFAALRKMDGHKPWYAAAGGPQSMRQLVKSIGMPTLYDSFRWLSRSVHAASPMESLNTDPRYFFGLSGPGQFGQLRSLRNIRQGVWQRVVAEADKFFWIGTRVFLAAVQPERLVRLDSFNERFRTPALEGSRLSAAVPDTSQVLAPQS